MAPGASAGAATGGAPLWAPQGPPPASLAHSCTPASAAAMLLLPIHAWMPAGRCSCPSGYWGTDNEQSRATTLRLEV